jgi:ArsR family transcriptional regulator, arsenate/arsenite/antimonite-responsive transcriptional repressor
MREFMAVAKALGDENRVRVLLFLDRGELCLCQIIGMLGLAPSTVSKHMAILYQARLVETRKEGRWIYYRLADAKGAECVAEAIRWVRKSLATDPKARDDSKRLRDVKKADLADLCCRYRD